MTAGIITPFNKLIIVDIRREMYKGYLVPYSERRLDDKMSIADCRLLS